MEETAKNVGYWQMRCNLAASKEVMSCLPKIIEGDRKTQPEMLQKLQQAMRNDLDVHIS